MSKKNSKQKLIVNNYGNGTVNINLGKTTQGPESPVTLDKQDHGFQLNDNQQDVTEDDPPGDDDMGGCTVFGNMCKASNNYGIEWVSRPFVAIQKNRIVFNHAAIRVFELRHNMAIMICETEDQSAIRFYLGQERFPNNNSINKYGFYRLKLISGCSGHKHKQQVDPRTGDTWVNPDWLTAQLYQRNQNGSSRNFPLMKKRPDLIGNMGALKLDRRFSRTVNGRQLYNVLYFRIDSMIAVAQPLVDKTIGKFENIVTARREWSTIENNV